MQASRLLPLLALIAGCSNDIQVAEGRNVAPAAVINSPAAGSDFLDTEVVEFVGIVSDGNGLDDLQAVTWTSSVQGELATIATAAPDSDGVTRTSVVLQTGNHAITLRVQDSGGLVAEASVDVAVGEESQDPTGIIDVPTAFQEFLPGENVQLAGSVDDAQDEPAELTAVWTITDNTSGTLIETIPSTPTSGGFASGLWVPADTGNYKITLAVTDTEGNSLTPPAEVLVVVVDPDANDQDGDLFTPSNGDCDDTDAAVNPNADEVCGNDKDDDCNSDLDDKDLDNDQHVDEDCVEYRGAKDIDDCDDARSDTYPGAPELQDGYDNDCDDAIDNGGPRFDDDGDCWCEVGPCTDSINASCASIDEGDCDDEDPTLSPDEIDDPDLSYVDSNCDGVDGDEAEAVFLDPSGGNDANNGLDRTRPKRTLTAAYTAATSAGRTWILISTGSLSFSAPTDSFREGINLAGGYDAGAAWGRSTLDVPRISVPAAGKTLTNWSTPTEWQQLHVEAPANTTNSGASVALVLDNSVGLMLSECEIQSGNGGNGLNGTNGVVGATGTVGERGMNGCIDSSFPCGSCADPQGGDGGGGCTAASNGGKGGASGNGGAAGVDGVDGSDGPTPNPPGGGAGGPKGTRNGDAGDAGIAGNNGATGNNGSAGLNVGTYTRTTGYAPANGGNGAIGQAGAGGGGGGGGAGGGWTFGNCDTRGGGGGGGGGGGCGGTGASGGKGGGASFGVVLLNNSSVVVAGGAIRTGDGGRGGDGGTGGPGGAGGTGAAGGNPETSLINEPSGAGGGGGDGGDGGRGGHGGGGGGGPSLGLYCDATSGASAAGVSFNVGNGGNGGGGSGAGGNTGLSAPDNCP